MHRFPTAPLATALFTLVVALAVSGPARAQEPPALPSGICQVPTHPGPLARAPRGADVNAAMRAADEQWSRAFRAMLARCRPRSAPPIAPSATDRESDGDVLALTHDARADALRLCDWDKPVHFPPAGVGAVCTYAGGVRETR